MFRAYIVVNFEEGRSRQRNETVIEQKNRAQLKRRTA